MGELYIPKPDQFEIERPLQPKKAVGDYVESQGILVPRRFSDLEEARHVAKQGVLVMERSEHPDEYNGPSGLGSSSQFVEDESGEFSPEAHYFPKQEFYEAYAQRAGLDPDDYITEMSESYWQMIPGVNVTVIADDAVEGRYHLFGYKEDRKDDPSWLMTGAMVTKNGEVERGTSYGDDTGFTSRHKEIIDIYNRVRGLEKFNNEHCPIVEMQISDSDGEIYFLQYHRARDAKPTPASLNTKDFDDRDGWVEADVVRGAYLDDRALELTLYYKGKDRYRVSADEVKLPEDGHLGNDSLYWLLGEKIGRQRTAHVMEGKFDKLYTSLSSNHGTRSRMFKPQASIGIGDKHDIPEELHKEAFNIAYSENKWVRLKTQVVSDGRRGFIKYGDELTAS